LLLCDEAYDCLCEVAEEPAMVAESGRGLLTAVGGLVTLEEANALLRLAAASRLD
jgi:hypothetical protein